MVRVNITATDGDLKLSWSNNELNDDGRGYVEDTPGATVAEGGSEMSTKTQLSGHLISIQGGRWNCGRWVL